MTVNKLKVNIESIVNEAKTDYHDGDIVVMDNLKDIPVTPDMCQMEMLLMSIVPKDMPTAV